jgi:hypothetical protein
MVEERSIRQAIGGGVENCHCQVWPDVETLAALAMRERRVLTLPEDAVVVSKSGNGRPLSDSVAPIQSDHGDFIGAVIVFRDATDRKRTDSANRNEEHSSVQLTSSHPQPGYFPEYSSKNQSHSSVRGTPLLRFPVL